jgi:hypothetical protein
MTTVLDEEDENLANFLESEVLSVSEQEEEVKAKRVRVDEEDKKQSVAKRMETGLLTKIPPELFPHILKFLSSEDLMLCSLVCRFLNYASSDEFLWRRLSVFFSIYFYLFFNMFVAIFSTFTGWLLQTAF